MAQVSSVASSPEAKTYFLASSDHTHLAILPQLPPTASANALDPAVSSGVVVTAFVILVPSSHTVRVAHDFHRQVEAMATGDSKVTSGRRAQPPPWDVDVSWATGISIAIIFANASPTFISGSAQRPGA